MGGRIGDLSSSRWKDQAFKVAERIRQKETVVRDNCILRHRGVELLNMTKLV